MIAAVPAYVSIVFILTTLITVGIFLFALRNAERPSAASTFLILFVFVWLTLQTILAASGFFQQFEAQPPRTFAFGPLPFIALTLLYLVFFRRVFRDMPLAALTLIHVIRIPVEITLLWLYQSGQVPIEMTFEGRNFDILSGITAPIVYFLAFRGGKVNRILLIVWNLAALALLVNIVTIAVLSFPSPFQVFGLQQPNVGVTYFPFVWLPSVIVPIVFFCHVASLYKLATGNTK
jgi:hypothetical protein